MDNLPASVAEQLRDLMLSETALAWLSIDSSLSLIGAGGDLRNHGLVSLRLGQPVVEQAFFLEGLLPLTEARDFVPSMELTSGRAADIHQRRSSNPVAGRCLRQRRGGSVVHGENPCLVQKYRGPSGRVTTVSYPGAGDSSRQR